MSAVSRHTEVLDQIARRIVGGDLPPGSVFTLANIGQVHGVSRTVAREVMRQLESLGLVTSSPRVGLVVLERSRWNVFDPRVIRWRLEGADRAAQLRSLTELRMAVEPGAAAAAARSATSGQRTAILRMAQEMQGTGEAGQLERFMEIDSRFHAAILQASGNEMFSALAPVIDAVLRWRTELGLMPPTPEPRALHDHMAIARAIATGDPASAHADMVDLVAEVQEAFDSRTPNVHRGQQPGARPGPAGDVTLPVSGL